jgi:hypothetical protein
MSEEFNLNSKSHKIATVSITLLIFALVLSVNSYASYMKSDKETYNRALDSAISDSTEATYTCPMHPEVISDKQGQCPKCGMDLILKEKGQKTPEEEKSQKKEKKDTNHNNHDHGFMGMGTEMWLIMGAMMGAMMIIFLMSGSNHR